MMALLLDGSRSRDGFPAVYIKVCACLPSLPPAAVFVCPRRFLILALFLLLVSCEPCGSFDALEVRVVGVQCRVSKPRGRERAVGGPLLLAVFCCRGGVLCRIVLLERLLGKNNNNFLKLRGALLCLPLRSCSTRGMDELLSFVFGELCVCF